MLTGACDCGSAHWTLRGRSRVGDGVQLHPLPPLWRALGLRLRRRAHPSLRPSAAYARVDTADPSLEIRSARRAAASLGGRGWRSIRKGAGASPSTCASPRPRRSPTCRSTISTVWTVRRPAQRWALRARSVVLAMAGALLKAHPPSRRTARSGGMRPTGGDAAQSGTAPLAHAAAAPPVETDIRSTALPDCCAFARVKLRRRRTACRTVGRPKNTRYRSMAAPQAWPGRRRRVQSPFGLTTPRT